MPFILPTRMNQRIFVEKKSAFDVESQKVLAELQEFSPITSLKQYVIYDVFDAQENTWDKLKTVLLDAVADVVHYENPMAEGATAFCDGVFARAVRSACRLCRASDTIGYGF